MTNNGNITRFNKVESPCWSASHIVELRDALNDMAKSRGQEPRDVAVEITLHELNLLVEAIKVKQCPVSAAIT